jgi:hypothetical protein
MFAVSLVALLGMGIAALVLVILIAVIMRR